MNTRSSYIPFPLQFNILHLFRAIYPGIPSFVGLLVPVAIFPNRCHHPPSRALDPSSSIILFA